MFESLTAFDVYLTSGGEIHTSAEKLFQGPIADALTDVAGRTDGDKTLQCWSRLGRSTMKASMNREAYDALKEGAACIDLAGRGKIRATGDDRAKAAA